MIAEANAAIREFTLVEIRGASDYCRQEANRIEEDLTRELHATRFVTDPPGRSLDERLKLSMDVMSLRAIAETLDIITGKRPFVFKLQGVKEFNLLGFEPKQTGAEGDAC